MWNSDFLPSPPLIYTGGIKSAKFYPLGSGFERDQYQCRKAFLRVFEGPISSPNLVQPHCELAYTKSHTESGGRQYAKSSITQPRIVQLRSNFVYLISFDHVTSKLKQ